MTKATIICDLDGTLCNIEHRLHHVQRDDGKLQRKPDWDAFFAEVSGDELVQPVMQLLEQMTHYNGLRYEIIFCTGRPERTRADTEEWLADNRFRRDIGKAPYPNYTYYNGLYMRKDGDYRRDDIVKQEILDAHINKDSVLFVLDDRQSVVDMWRRNGMTCFQVAKGDF